VLSQKIIRKLLLIIVCFFCINGSLPVHAEESSEKQKIKLLTDEIPKVDIKLAVGDADINIEQFKRDLKEELESRGMKDSSFHLVTTEQKTVSTQMENAEEIFNKWGKIGWPGEWSYDDATKTITNAENTDNFTGFYYPGSFEYRNIDFSFMNGAFDWDDDVMGAMVRFNKNADGTVTTYVFSLDRSDANGGVPQDQGGGGFYKIVKKPFSYTEVTLLQGTSAVWTRYEWEDYRIVAKENHFQVYQNDQLIIDYIDKDNPIEKGSYGFFSYSQPYSMYKDITVVTENTMSFMQVLENTKWEKDSLHFLINLNDTQENFFTEDALKEEVKKGMQANKIHYIGWGTSELQQVTEAYVSENLNRGTFIDSNNYEQSIISIADYIIWRTIFSEGSGMESDPFIIRTSEQIDSIQYDLSSYYRLEEDIDFQYGEFEGIGNLNAPFTGHFDGNGYEIKNIYISGKSQETGNPYKGFFGVISNAYIENVYISGADVRGSSCVGGLVGYAYGSESHIENCHVGEVSVSGKRYIGGLIGKIEGGIILKCESMASVYGGSYSGGMIGYSQKTILKNIVSLATVTGAEYIGGIIGKSETTRIEQCESLANVNGFQYIGGITGFHDGKMEEDIYFNPYIVDCCCLGTVKGNCYVGGIAGFCKSAVLENCNTDGTLEGKEYLGNIVGAESDSSMIKC